MQHTDTSNMQMKKKKKTQLTDTAKNKTPKSPSQISLLINFERVF